MTLRAFTLPLSALVASAFAFAACSDSASNPASSLDAGLDAAAPLADAGPAIDGAAVADASGDAGSDAASRFATRVVVRDLSVGGHDRLFNVAFDRLGRSVAVGQLCPSTVATDDCVSVVARFLPDGSADTTFGVAGVATVNFVVGGSAEVARGLVLTADDKIVIAGIGEQRGATEARERDIYVARFLANGQLDTAFGTAGVATVDLNPGKLVGSVFKTDVQWGLAQDAQGRLYVSGACVAAGRDDTDFALVRLTASGSRDASFGTAGVTTVDVQRLDATPKEVLVDASGRAVMGGYYTDPTSTIVSPLVVRFTATGALDGSFGTGGVFTREIFPAAAEVYGVALQGEKIVTAGYGRASTNVEMDFLSLRLEANGSLDSSYGSAGHRLVDLAGGRDTGRTLKVLPSGAVLLVGSGRRANGDQDAMFAMLSANGAPEVALGANGARAIDLGGASDALWGVAVDAERAVAVGVVSGGVVGSDAAIPDDDAALVFLDLR